MIHPLSSNKSIVDASITNKTSTNTLNSTNSADIGVSKSQATWFSRAFKYIPGYTWMKTTVGQLIFGPTYNMTRTQLRAYKLAEDHEYKMANLKEELEAEFKTAVFMAEEYPGYYLDKYVKSAKKGSEKRKRALFLFVIHNKRVYDNYYGEGRSPQTFLNKVFLDKEFEEMGLDLKGHNFMEDFKRSGRDHEE